MNKAILTLLLVLPVFAQISPNVRPSFEVASIKPVATTGPRFMDAPPGGRFIATGQSLKALVGFAYRMRSFQVLGGPVWVSSDLWEIDAKAEEGAVPTRAGTVDPTKPDAIALMLQSLLEERFQLKVHVEKRDLPVFELLVAKGGPKMRLSEDQGPIVSIPMDPEARLAQLRQGLSRGGLRISVGSIQASAIPVSQFVTTLTSLLDRQVIDKTELKGLYDINLKWMPEDLPGGQGIFGANSIFTPLQDQLGLRLSSTKAPLDVIVIESAQKPTPN